MFFRVKKYCFGSGRKAPGLKPGRPLIYCGLKVSSGRVIARLHSIESFSSKSMPSIIKYNGFLEQSFSAQLTVLWLFNKIKIFLT